MPMTVQSMHSVGLLVPPSNPTLEIEIKQLLDDQVYLYVSRFPVFPDCDLAERNRRYLQEYLDASLRFGKLSLSAIIVGLTGSNYASGPDEDRRFCQELSTRLNVPFATTSLAIIELLRHLNSSVFTLSSLIRNGSSMRRSVIGSRLGLKLSLPIRFLMHFRLRMLMRLMPRIWRIISNH